MQQDVSTSIPEALQQRLGYQGLLRAAAFNLGVPVEIALVSPESGVYEGHMVLVHHDCDPDEPSQGASSAYGPYDLVEAKTTYDTLHAELIEDEKGYRALLTSPRQVSQYS